VRLEKFQRNAIYRGIEAGGLDPRECVLTDDADEARIHHVPSGSTFTLRYDDGKYIGSYVVGDSALAAAYEAYPWTRVPETAERWAAEVKRDVDTPDLWADVQRERQIVTRALDETSENRPFTPAGRRKSRISLERSRST
jgi:hypothetical protein